MLCLSFVGCVEPASSVIVDNTTDRPMVVEVNGQKAVEVLPGTFEWVSCMPGEYEFRVTSGNDELYRSTHSLEPAKQYLRSRTYVLNPADSCGYTIATVDYGSRNVVSQGIEAGLVALAEQSKGQQLAPITRAFIALKRKTRPLPAAPWIEAKGAYYLLQQPPKSVATRVGRVEYYTVLTRVSKNDQEAINRAHGIKAPSLADITALSEATGRAFQGLFELAPPPGATAMPVAETSSNASESI